MNLISIKNTMTSGYKSIGALLIIILLTTISCDMSVTPEDPKIASSSVLSESTWNVGEVNQSGTDISAAFSGATITFTSNGEYSTTIDPLFDHIWPASGTWSLLSIELIRVNEIDMTISFFSASSVTLKFTAQEPGGRISGLGGDYIMTLTR